MAQLCVNLPHHRIPIPLGHQVRDQRQVGHQLKATRVRARVAPVQAPPHNAPVRGSAGRVGCHHAHVILVNLHHVRGRRWAGFLSPSRHPGGHIKARVHHPGRHLGHRLAQVHRAQHLGHQVRQHLARLVHKRLKVSIHLEPQRLQFGLLGRHPRSRHRRRLERARVVPQRLQRQRLRQYRQVRPRVEG